MSDESKPFRYEYRDPLANGYTLTRITRGQLKSIGIGHGRGSWLVKADVYWHPEQGYQIEYVARLTGKILLTLFLPVAIVLFGLFNIKDTMRDYRRSMQQRKYGSFTSDQVFPREEKYYPRLEALRTGQAR